MEQISRALNNFDTSLYIQSHHYPGEFLLPNTPSKEIKVMEEGNSFPARYRVNRCLLRSCKTVKVSFGGS